MSLSNNAPPFPAAMRDRLRHIRLACFDIDGTLTDGKVLYDVHGNHCQAFDTQDGLGLKLLTLMGIAVVLITARHSQAARHRGQDLGIPVYDGVTDKRACVQQLVCQHQLALPTLLFMGDDLVDLPALIIVGLAVAPANAHPWVAQRVHWQTQASGGQGAVREVCDALLTSQGHRQTILERFTQ